MGLFDKRKIAALSGVLKQSLISSAVKVKAPFIKNRDNQDGVSVVGLSSVIGRREYQQDVISTSRDDVRGAFDEKWMAVLCDGMGGMNGGEKASSLCARRMLSDFNQQIDNIPEFFRNEIIEIDREVSQLTDENGQVMGAGSTLISIIIDKGNLYWSSVGDSHIYIMRAKEFVQVNNDHNYLSVLLERARHGEITLEQAYKDRQREALISYMGIGNVSIMDISQRPFRLKKDDVIILCSDGLYRSLSEDEMHNIILQNINDMPAAANSLTAAAIAKKIDNQDNTSVITVKYQ